MSIDRRTFLAASAAAAAVPALLAARSRTVFRPEDFGARGDGVTNDTAAFAALSAAVNRRGGGAISLTAGRTYIVGAQARGAPPAAPGESRFGWQPSAVLLLDGLDGPLTILGNGARLRCQPGLRFGTFDLASGEPVEHPMPNSNRTDLATPYRAMIQVQKCRGPIEIRDVELDGNLERLRIGGKFGDKGWQISATGLRLAGNTGPELVENVYAHHNAQDGAIVKGTPDRSARSRLRRLTCRYNGRQGLSVVGGRGYDLEDCEFSHSGRSAIMSPPGAGVDIEAEGRLVRDLSFTRCRFVDNRGVGMVAPVGDSADVRFADCEFVGTTSWSAWPNKPRFAFDRCTFVGAIVHAFANADPAHATRFAACLFTDDPRLSPTGQVYTANGPIANIARSDNVLFDRCTFRLVGDGTLPTSRGAIYRDCTMSQRSARKAMTRGRFLGTTTINGPVDLSGSNIEGSVILNGRRVPRSRASRAQAMTTAPPTVRE